MSVFGKYSSYYDLLYKDKDYAGEADFVCRLLERFGSRAKNLLELGCGSGGHALELSKRGFGIHGVDVSGDMLSIAEKERNRLLPFGAGENLSFSQGDIRELALNKTFDAAISLFHVISYLPTLRDIEKVFKRVSRHLNPGGLFVFDVWYAPAVLTEKPEVRVKRMENDEIAVIRIAEPICYPNECWVDVCYKVFIRDKKTNRIEELDTEIHRMRYLSIPEIEMLADNNHFEIVFCGEWMTEKPPALDTWGVCFVLKSDG